MGRTKIDPNYKGYVQDIKEMAAKKKEKIEREGFLAEDGMFGKYSSELTLKQKGFIIDYLMLGGDNYAAEAARLNYDTKEFAKQIAYSLLRNPKIKAAIEYQLERAGSVIDEDYLAKRLKKLEAKAERQDDNGSWARALDLMMKLKGLGSTKVINENHEKAAFEMMTQADLEKSLVETVGILAEGRKLDLDKFIEDVKELQKGIKEKLESGNGGEVSSVEVVEAEYKELAEA